ncbi:3-oxoacyl-[acyl-carrier protein] reductase [hydrothermal vent metagenome]|uniref:3-oxoacyl-[acyl-carrier protein] reductase n=1 Tax=hydrothermal vent metagenome TaxID=652676 RepID=A0A3B0UN00_9ZZZZ
MDFTGKTVLVTGGSRGVGRAICQQFAQRGAQVIVHFNHNRAAAEETAASLAGENHLLAQAQMEDVASLQKMVNRAVSHYGRIDILVNNAGIYEAHPLAEVTFDEWQAAWRQTLAVNLVGVANLTYLVGQQMILQGNGRIVNVSSRGAFRGEPTAPAYGASKAGLNAMSQSLAKYLAPHNIFVGVVAPGFVETEMAAKHLAGETGDGIRGQSPLNRVATPDEVAYPVLFLAAEGTQFLTGAIIDVNGASYLRT